MSNSLKKILGMPTINPFLFSTGKVAGYILWIWYLFELFTNQYAAQNNLQFTIHVVLILLGLLITVISIINLGKSTRLGLPREETELKTHGLFSYSRNPIYVAFLMLSLATVISTLSIVALLLFIYSTVVYHLIILGEERFLEGRFGPAYIEYKTKVRRYL